MRTILLTLLLLTLGVDSWSQDQTSVVDRKINAKMKDSLQLTTLQAERIDSVNRLISMQKSNLRVIHSNIDSLTIHTQLVERSRDSLYQLILPPSKYLLYKEKKRTIISNN